MTRSWDLVVVGAGPAGSVAALAALQAVPDLRVLLLDRAEFPRDKVCGDGVAPQVLDVLAELGVPDLLADWPAVPRLRLGFPEGDPPGPQVARPLRRPTYVVPREVLDARLRAAAVARGAHPLTYRVRGVTLRPDGALLVPSGLPTAGELRAAVVVAADGAHSVVRATLGLRPRHPGRVAIALRGYAPVPEQRRSEQVIMFPRDASWPAYAWSFPIGDGRANVGYGELLPATGPGPARARMLRRLEELLPGSTAGGTAWRAHHLPLSTGRVAQPDGRVLLTGDALGLINPLTGEGIHAAVRTGAVAGRAAAEAIRAGRPELAGQRYRRALAATRGRHLRQLDVIARLGADPRVIAGGIRAAARSQRVFDELIDLGLADGTVTLPLVASLLRVAGPGGVARTLAGALRG